MILKVYHEWVTTGQNGRLALSTRSSNKHTPRPSHAHTHSPSLPRDLILCSGIELVMSRVALETSTSWRYGPREFSSPMNTRRGPGALASPLGRFASLRLLRAALYRVSAPLLGPLSLLQALVNHHFGTIQRIASETPRRPPTLSSRAFPTLSVSLCTDSARTLTGPLPPFHAPNWLY